MKSSIYLAAPEGLTGKSMVAVGIMDLLQREVSRVAVFRPIVNAGRRDEVLEVLVSQPHIEQTYDEGVGVTYDDIRDDQGEALARLVDKFAVLRENHDAVVIVGSDYTDISTPTELTFNARVAANLNTPVLLVVSGRNRSPEQVLAAAESAVAEFTTHHAKVISVVANRVDPQDLAAVRERLETIPDVVAEALPSDRLLAAPSIGEQFEAVQANLVLGNPELLVRESVTPIVAAMTLPNVLQRLETDATVIMPGDRTDLLPGVLLANASGAFPHLSGIILVGGYEIPESISRLVSTVKNELPIGMTHLGTYTTAERLFPLEGAMTSTPRKVEIARRIFSENVDSERLLQALEVHRSDVVTPLMFEHQLMELARSDRKTIVLPESTDDRILQSAAILTRRGVADLILLGDPTVVKTRATHLGIGLSGVEIIDPSDPELLDRFAEEYARKRAHKGVSFEEARAKMADLSYFGTMMVHLGMADGMVSGAINTTANTIRPSLEFIKTKPGVSVVSGSFLMCLPDRVVVYADCAVNPNPTAEQLADIAISSAQTAEKFGIEPRVAMLSYSTGTSGAGADVDKVREATRIVQERAPELALEGPIQFDAAVDPVVARTKLPDSPVAGRATVFVFPDLNTGNNTYKAVQRSAGAVAIGPVLQGLNKAVNDLSRGALIDDIVNTVAITAIQAQTEHLAVRRSSAARPRAVAAAFEVAETPRLSSEVAAPAVRRTSEVSRPILLLNCGSSSIKYQVIDAATEEVIANGIVQRIGDESGTIDHTYNGEVTHETHGFPDHGRALKVLTQVFEQVGPNLSEVVAVGHRTVHGGSKFRSTTVINDRVLQALHELSPLAPLHNPPGIAGIEAARAILPHVPHVAVFDTAFFSTLPPEAHTYAIDAEIAEKHGIRKYGFHGTSHSYVSKKVAEVLGRPYGELNQIVCHLGNGASISAIRGGVAVEASMGLTPLAGLVMGTRSGDVDAGLHAFLTRQTGMSVEEVDAMLNKKSGLLGLSGVTDFRDLNELIKEGNRRAQLALDVYCHRLLSYIGSYLAVLGRVDALTFTAGVGENDPQVRATVVRRLAPFGFELDEAANAVRSKEPRVISSSASSVAVLVVPTNEELAMARETIAAIA